MTSSDGNPTVPVADLLQEIGRTSVSCLLNVPHFRKALTETMECARQEGYTDYDVIRIISQVIRIELGRAIIATTQER